MKSSEDIKAMVRDKYSKIVKDEIKPDSTCCGPNIASSCCSGDETYTIFNDNYKSLDGHVEDADLGLGCGIPTKYAGIEEGNTVLDLGSGAGNDVFVARKLVGDSGKVIGLDMTTEMINKANENNTKMGYDNVSFVLGEIEDMPLQDNTIDVVLSNCVLNLVPDKYKAYREIFRVLKPKGHFSISDVVLEGELSAAMKDVAELYAGCVSGALQEEDYLSAIENAGFENIEILKKKEIHLPEATLEKYLSKEEINKFRDDKIGIYSITVVGNKN